MNKQETILLVDDEADIIEMVKYNLEKEGYAVLTARNGKHALEEARHIPDLIILDVMMPEMDGWEVLRQLKRDPRTADIPVLFLTAKGSEVDEIVGFELGAEDYIVKPISIRKLIVRARAVLRRKHSPEKGKKSTPAILKVEKLEINIPNYTVSIGTREITLARKEFETLVYLVEQRGRVISRESLLNVVWGENVHVVDRTVDVHISKIREKLGSHGDIIETVKGVGYRVRA
jgi:two-component system, OmpR family, alkaline phosphatase synthesis response regulator PhoP